MLRQSRKSIDITGNPELLRLVREMEHTRRSLSLREDDHEVAVLMPARRAGQRHTKRAKTTADYEAFLAAAGSWKDVDTEQFLADVYESRRRSSRPPVEL